MTHCSVNCRRSKEPNTGLKAQRLCPEVSCSSGRNGGLGSSVTSAKIGRYEKRFSSQRRPNNSEEVDSGTSEVLHHVTDTNEEANLPREPGADDSGDESVNSSSGIVTKVPTEPSADDSGHESVNSSSGIGTKVPTEPSADDSGDESVNSSSGIGTKVPTESSADDSGHESVNSSSGIGTKVPTESSADDSGDESDTSSSSDSVHTRDEDKDDGHNSVPKHVAERVSSPVKHSVPIKQKSTRVTGVQQDADTEPCVSAEPEYQYTEDAACSGTVCTVPNSPTTQTQEPDSDETQTKEEVSAETQTPESAETQTEEPDLDETQTNEVVSAETVSAATQTPESAETQTEEPDSDETDQGPRL
uniref:nucleolin 1-like n=1 Tax=Oncorhynchus gorbuscha TaxID=8017 RepID=UPI001EAEF4BC|nr:nucleolin 1-like [Oncorhynchus gorbuscha]